VALLRQPWRPRAAVHGVLLCVLEEARRLVAMSGSAERVQATAKYDIVSGVGVDMALRRVPLVARLLGTFIVVSIVPIGTLASLALWEASEAREAGAEEMHGLSVTVFELAVAGISLVLSIVVALAVARSLTRPLRELDETIARVEGGDLRARASVAGADELADLAGAFNRMVDGLERGRDPRPVRPVRHTGAGERRDRAPGTPGRPTGHEHGALLGHPGFHRHQRVAARLGAHLDA
jgi:HAMP domain-containing protein